MLDAGCWMLDAGCRMLDSGCWMLDAKFEFGISEFKLTVSAILSSCAP